MGEAAVPHRFHPARPGGPRSRRCSRSCTGTVDMIRRCAEAGLPEPEFEVGAGFLIRIWRAGDRATTGSDREPPDNSQKTARRAPEDRQKST